MWSQLSLKASLTSTEKLSSDSILPVAELVLTLAHSQTSSTAKTKFDNPAFSTTQDISPPTSVPYAYLNEVKILFRFSFILCGSPTPAAKRRRLDFASCHRPNSDMLFNIHKLDGPNAIEHSQPSFNNRLQTQLSLYGLPTGDLFTRQESSPSTQDQISPIACSQNTFHIEIGTAAMPCPKRSSTSNPQEAENVNSTDLARLIDLGLRSMICDIVKVKSSDINMLSVPERPKLSEIAPGLFSPGYMHVSDFFTLYIPTAKQTQR